MNEWERDINGEEKGVGGLMEVAIPSRGLQKI
jgi:hypothetical protein